MSDFCHLHCHSEYSLLDGMSRIKDMVARAVELGQPAIALTDHGVMFGAIEFYRAAKKAGIKPIMGVEAYLAARRMGDRDPQADRQRFHMLLLAENQTGYQNLLTLSSKAQLEGFYGRPRIDRELLAQYSEGLIATTGCLAAEVPRTLVNHGEEAALRKLKWYLDVFGRDRFFLELQPHDIPELHQVNGVLTQWARKHQIGLVATNDVHYVMKEDARPHDILLCIQTRDVRSNPGRMRLTPDGSYYLTSHDEMLAAFRDYPEALSNTVAIAERCDVALDSRGYHLPEFEVPPGYDPESYVRYLVEAGVVERYGERRAREDEELRARVERELGIIHSMGFDNYFLIVWDLCVYAEKQDIWWNVRGSGAGSVVAYALKITNIDPLKYDLLFDRFLNEHRVSMPDIDIDFPDDRRHEMIEYAVRRYGEDRCAAIITFGTLGARAAVRDVGRALEVPLSEVDRVARMVPNVPGKPVTLDELLFDKQEEPTEREATPAEGLAAEEVEEWQAEKLALRELYASDTTVRELLDTALMLEGQTRHASTHAAGVVIADRPVIEYAPLHRPTKGDDSGPINKVVQFDMNIVESIGLLKVDFLGLATLSIMRRACEHIEERHGVKLDLNTIPYERCPEEPTRDAAIMAAYRLMQDGHTVGVFQVEGAGLRRVLQEMRPDQFEHIVAAISLYRPGPMEYIPSYIRRMHGEEPISYHHRLLEDILGTTYGICVYQEQLMRMASDIAGYSPAEADLMRRAVSKKKKEEIDYHKGIFVEGAQKRGLSQHTAERIYADIEYFARYGFNKCLTGDTEVVDATTGRSVKIEDLYAGRVALTHTLTCDTETMTLRHGAVSQVMFNGVKPVFRLATASGRRIEATVNHPFYTRDGWRLLGELEAGDLIAVPQRLPAERGVSYRIAIAQATAGSNASQVPTDYGLRTTDYEEFGWDAITSIEYIGEKPTYDLEVPGTHNFVANDILVHNSHAADYAVITVQTAYLKAHYPVEYLCALLEIEFDDTEKVPIFLNECRRLGINVLPPDLNQSGERFTIEADATRGELADEDYHRWAIRIGMGAIKNVGLGAVEMILEERQASGPFDSLDDFASRVDLRKLNKRVLECLAKVGVFDALVAPAAPDYPREVAVAVVERMMSASEEIHAANDVGQLTMFDLLAGPASGGSVRHSVLSNLPSLGAINPRERLDDEKELLGIYISDHPLQQVAAEVGRSITCFCGELAHEQVGQSVVIAGLVSSVRVISTKKGDQMAFVRLEDLQGDSEVVVFPRTYTQSRDLLINDAILLVRGKVEARNDRLSVLADVIQKYEPNGQVTIGLALDDHPAPLAFGELPHEMPPLPAEAVTPAGPTLLDGINHHITLTLERSSDDARDVQRIQRIIEALGQFAGEDRITVQLRADGRTVQLDFPELGTSWNAHLRDQLLALGVSYESKDLTPDPLARFRRQSP